MCPPGVGRAGCQELTFAGCLGGTVLGFPVGPGYGGARPGFPVIGGTGEVLTRQDCRGGNGKELVIGHREVSSSEFVLGIPEHVDVLGDAVREGVVSQHLGGEIH